MISSHADLDTPGDNVEELCSQVDVAEDFGEDQGRDLFERDRLVAPAPAPGHVIAAAPGVRAVGSTGSPAEAPAPPSPESPPVPPNPGAAGTAPPAAAPLGGPPGVRGRRMMGLAGLRAFFQQVLADWRAEGSLPGLELTS